MNKAFFILLFIKFGRLYSAEIKSILILLYYFSFFSSNNVTLFPGSLAHYGNREVEKLFIKFIRKPKKVRVLPPTCYIFQLYFKN